MKKSFRLFMLIFIIVIESSGCSLGLNHYEGKLYSDKKFTHDVDSSNKQKLNIFTRDKAIEKALLTFDKGFNIKLDRSKLTESIKLSNYYTNNYIWIINWTDSSARQSYVCNVDSSNGDIQTISTVSSDELGKSETINPYKITSNEAINLCNSLFTELQINPKDYLCKSSTNRLYFKYCYFVFYNIKDSKQQFIISVDCENKKVVSFQKYEGYISN